uniref:Uncharacterized protein n=1 Tax=Arundo donax TaxID=35708 RepID=A0A0A9GNL8_ARUDO
MPEVLFRNFATSKMNDANDDEGKTGQMGSLLILDVLTVHLRV